MTFWLGFVLALLSVIVVCAVCAYLVIIKNPRSYYRPVGLIIAVLATFSAIEVVSLVCFGEPEFAKFLGFLGSGTLALGTALQVLLVAKSTKDVDAYFISDDDCREAASVLGWSLMLVGGGVVAASYFF